MKHRSKILGVLMALCLVLSLIPTLGITAMAEPGATYTVTFHANGHGTAPEPLQVKEGQTFGQALDETSQIYPIPDEGWQFEDWYIDEACTELANLYQPIYEDMDLYAAWNAVESIDSVNVTFRIPKVGQPLSTRPDVETDPAAHYGCSPYEMRWHLTDTGYIDEVIEEGAVFEAGKTYYLELSISAEFGYIFQGGTSSAYSKREGNLTLTINGEDRTDILGDSYMEGYLHFLIPFTPSEEPDESIESVDLIVPDPVPGEVIENPVIEGGNTYSIRGAYWFLEGREWQGFEEGETFQENTQYIATIFVKPNYGYVFTPDTKVTVNGSTELLAKEIVTEGNAWWSPGDLMVKALFPMESKAASYQIIEGADSTWTKGSGEDLRVVSDGPFDAFKAVLMDGETVAAEHYTVERGSTGVTFHSDYLETLEEGEHELALQFVNGEASTTLTVDPAPVEEPTQPEDPAPVEEPTQPEEPAQPEEPTVPELDPDHPDTGDEAQPVVWMALAVTSLAGAVWVASRRRRAR